MKTGLMRLLLNHSVCASCNRAQEGPARDILPWNSGTKKT